MKSMAVSAGTFSGTKKRPRILWRSLNAFPGLAVSARRRLLHIRGEEGGNGSVQDVAVEDLCREVPLLEEDCGGGVPAQPRG